MKPKSNEIEVNEQSKNAILYLSRLPYGFTDDAARQFFSQFGDIKGVCFPRSKITARSKGYMFVLFEDREIAEIAAKTMNDYMMHGKLLKAKVLPENSKIVYDKFIKQSRKFKFVPWKLLFSKAFNKNQTEEQMERKMERLVEHDREKAENFKRMKIDYEFPTYESLLKK